jgi:hypothetical protein
MLVFAVLTVHVRMPGGSIHDCTFPKPIADLAMPLVFPSPVPGKYLTLYIEGPSTIRWVNQLQHKLAGDVEFDGWNVAQEGHDVGMLIPHIPAVPDPIGAMLAVGFSKYKISFSASTVKVDGKPVGTYFPVIAPPLYCFSPVSMPAVIPTVHNIVPWPCTVRVGMTAGDFGAGWFSVASDQALDLFFNIVFGSGGPGKLKDKVGQWGEQLFEKIGLPSLKAVGKKLFQDTLKKNLLSPVKQKLELPLGLGSVDKKGNLKLIGIDVHKEAKEEGKKSKSDVGASLEGLGPGIVLPEGTPHID